VLVDKRVEDDKSLLVFRGLVPTAEEKS
jgi:hypothetical protein